MCFESRDGTTVTVVGAQQVTSLRTGAVTNYRLADVGLLVRRPSGREKVISLFKLTKIALTKTSCGPMQRSDPKRQRAFVLADGTEVLEFGERWCPDMVRLTSTSRFMMIMRPTANVWLEEVEAELC